MKYWVLTALLLLGACTPAPQAVVCNAPYILVGTSCCLDANANGICDADEPAPAPVEEVKAPEVPPATIYDVQAAVRDALGAKTAFLPNGTTVQDLAEDVNNSHYKFSYADTSIIIELQPPGRIENTTAFAAFMNEYGQVRYHRLLAFVAEAMGTGTYTDSLIKTDEFKVVPAYELQNQGDIVVYSDWAKVYEVSTSRQGKEFTRNLAPFVDDAVYVYCTPQHVVAVYYAGSSATAADWASFKDDAYAELIKEHRESEVAAILPRAQLVWESCQQLKLPPEQRTKRAVPVYPSD